MSTELYIIYTITFVILAALILFVLAGKYILIGLKVFWAKLLYKENAGFVLFINRSGKILTPKVINLSKSVFEYKKKTYPLATGKIDGDIFGLPFLFINTDDTTRNAGIYYPITDNDGNQVFYEDITGNVILDKDNNPIPKYGTNKQGAVLDPEFLRSIILDQALTTALKDLFSKQKNLMILLIVAAGASVAAAYFGFDFTQNQLPQLMSLAQTAAQCGAVTP